MESTNLRHQQSPTDARPRFCLKTRPKTRVGRATWPCQNKGWKSYAVLSSGERSGLTMPRAEFVQPVPTYHAHAMRCACPDHKRQDTAIYALISSAAATENVTL